MPAGKSSGGGNTMFMNIVLGSLRVRHQNPIEGVTETRIIETGGSKKEIHEEVFSYIEGRIEMITIKESDNDYGDQMKILLNDGEQKFSVGTQVDGSYSSNFMNRMCNVDLNKPIKLTPYRIEREDRPGKYNTGISIMQDGEKVKPFFTKDSEQKLPGWEKFDLPNGKVVWDSTKQIKALIGSMAKRIYDSGLNCITVPAKWTNKGEPVNGEPVKGLSSESSTAPTEEKKPLGGNQTPQQMFKEKPKEPEQPQQQSQQTEESPQHLGGEYEPDDLPF